MLATPTFGPIGWWFVFCFFASENVLTHLDKQLPSVRHGVSVPAVVFNCSDPKEKKSTSEPRQRLGAGVVTAQATAAAHTVAVCSTDLLTHLHFFSEKRSRSFFSFFLNMKKLQKHSPLLNNSFYVTLYNTWLLFLFTHKQLHGTLHNALKSGFSGTRIIIPLLSSLFWA